MGGAPHAVETWDTGVDAGLLKLVGRASVITPGDFVSILFHNVADPVVSTFFKIHLRHYL